ncbi:unnamed protein product [Arabidopsis thaliana]|uniref:(thale cress) hypothetical protein n=1 Tax=Arabidopsis thaliana TaxID=3702 RepID=A0A7G2EEP6_ARATH|nr:unnamed protein product [Arabidopsis thaliana]
MKEKQLLNIPILDLSLSLSVSVSVSLQLQNSSSASFQVNNRDRKTNSQGFYLGSSATPFSTLDWAYK